ncbi:hypothetical protein BH09ACT4_BH09ACT4_19940 [soil metagenome]
MRARVVASAGLAALVAVLLAGCNFITPQATLKPYDPSDGVSVKMGDIDVLNALVLSDDGVSGNLVFTALNTSGKTVDLTVQYPSLGAKTDIDLKVAPNGTTDFGGFNGSEQVFLTAIDTAPGSLLSIYFQYGDQQGRQLMVPVLDGSLEQYSPFLPQTPTPTPVATETPTPSPTPTP